MSEITAIYVDEFNAMVESGVHCPACHASRGSACTATRPRGLIEMEFYQLATPHDERMNMFHQLRDNQFSGKATSIAAMMSEALKADLLKVSDSGAGIAPLSCIILDTLGLRTTGLSCMFLNSLGIEVRTIIKLEAQRASERFNLGASAGSPPLRKSRGAE